MAITPAAVAFDALIAFVPDPRTFSADIAGLAPRRLCLDRQVCGGSGVSVPRTMRSRLRRNAQAGSRAWQRSHQAADRPAAKPLSQEKQYPGPGPARK